MVKYNKTIPASDKFLLCMGVMIRYGGAEKKKPRPEDVAFSGTLFHRCGVLN